MIPSRFKSDSSDIIFDGTPLSVHKLAKELEVDPSYMFRVFQGRRMPSRRYAKMLATRLHIPTEVFVRMLKRQATNQTTTQTTRDPREPLEY